MAFLNRIVETGEADPKKLLPNPKNWRKHPDNQAEAMSGILDEIGWIQDVIVNRRTGRMIDGHLRVEIAIKNKEPTVPVSYVDLSEEEEEKAILTFDPLGAMAEADKKLLEELMGSVSSDSEAVNKMMDSLCDEHGVVMDEIPEVENDVSSITTKAGQYDKKKMPINIGGLLVFIDQDEQHLYGDFDIFYSDKINESEEVKELTKKKASELADEIRSIL
jgi:hypothetical protein